MEYKTPKTLNEQIEYLKTDKRVVFNEINEKDALEILKTHGYINVISPFKFYFALKDEYGNPIKSHEGKHIYEREVDFSEYYSLYKKEREIYPQLFKNISTFERIFNSIVAYECIHFYNIFNSEKFDLFLLDLENNINQSSDREAIKAHYFSSITRIRKEIKEFNSIYILMDRLTLNESFTLFKCSSINLKKQIFAKLLAEKCTLNENRIANFEKKFTKLVLIRNHVYHNNSLTVLIRYFKVGTKELRKASERTTFRKLIDYLANND